MACVVKVWCNNGVVRRAKFLNHSRELMQDFCRDVYGSIPFNYREGIPSPMLYEITEVLE